MSEAFYQVEWDEDCDWDESYDMLRGPDGFECLLTEPEDRIWLRDGRPVVAKLNEQADAIELLTARLAAAEAERGHDCNGDDDRHSGLRERLHDTQLALYQANEDKGLLERRLRSAEKQAADNGGKVLQLHNENERTKKALAAANADIDRLNQMLRATGYGQGQIDAYDDECEARERADERLAAAEARIDRALALSDTGSAAHQERFYNHITGYEIPPGWRVVEAMRGELING